MIPINLAEELTMHDQEIRSRNTSKEIRILDKTKWRTLIEEWKESNESQKAFCNRLGLNINTFTYMRGKFLKKDDKYRVAKFIPVAVKDANMPIDLKEIILESANGIKLRIPTSINLETFKQLLTLLGWQHA